MDDCRRHIKKEIANLARRSTPAQTGRLAIRSRGNQSAGRLVFTNRKSFIFWEEFRRSSSAKISQQNELFHEKEQKRSNNPQARAKSAFYRQMLQQEDQANNPLNAKDTIKQAIASKLVLNEAQIKRPKRDLIEQHLFKKVRSGSHSPSNSEVYLESKMGKTQRPSFSQPFFKLYQV